METTNNNQETTISKQEYDKIRYEEKKHLISLKKKAYYKANKEKRLAYQKEYAKANKDKVNAYQIYYRSTPNFTTSQAKYYLANKERLREKAKMRYSKIKGTDLYREQRRKWRENCSKKIEHFYKFTKDTGLSYKVEILKMNKVEAKKYAELHKYNYAKC